MNFQNLFAPTNIGQAYMHLTVKTTRTQQSRIQYVRTVSRRNDNNTFSTLETIHLYKQLVERLFTLIISTAHTHTTTTTNSIYLIDKDDTRRMLFSLLKHISYSRCPNTDKHFNEIRTGNRKERHFRFASNCFS